MTRERWTWTIAAGAMIIALVAGFAMGRVTAGGSTQESSVEVEETTIPQYGDSAARDAYTTAETTTNSRLIGRSVWNTEWLLIIPGGTLLFDPDTGLDTFLNEVTDIKLFFQTYSYTGE